MTNLEMARRVAKIAAIALLASAGIATLTGCRARPERTLLFFYQAVCASCEDSQRMEALAREIVELGRTDRRTTAEAHNVYQGNGLEVFQEASAQLGTDARLAEFPVLIVDGRESYHGEGEIVAKLDGLRDE